MPDPKWFAEDKAFAASRGQGAGSCAVAEIAALKRAHAHVKELRDMMATVLDKYTQCGIQHNYPIFPKEHQYADALLNRDEPPEVK